MGSSKPRSTSLILANRPAPVNFRCAIFSIGAFSRYYQGWKLNPSHPTQRYTLSSFEANSPRKMSERYGGMTPRPFLKRKGRVKTSPNVA